MIRSYKRADTAGLPVCLGYLSEIRPARFLGVTDTLSDRRRRPYPRANIFASVRNTGATASIKRAAASSTASPAVSTTAAARA
jgi:hypothetical protein